MKIKWLIIIGVKSQGGRIALKEEDGPDRGPNCTHAQGLATYMLVLKGCTSPAIADTVEFLPQAVFLPFLPLNRAHLP